eukprot:g20390.t1
MNSDLVCGREAHLHDHEALGGFVGRGGASASASASRRICQVPARPNDWKETEYQRNSRVGLSCHDVCGCVPVRYCYLAGGERNGRCPLNDARTERDCTRCARPSPTTEDVVGVPEESRTGDDDERNEEVLSATARPLKINATILFIHNEYDCERDSDLVCGYQAGWYWPDWHEALGGSGPPPTPTAVGGFGSGADVVRPRQTCAVFWGGAPADLANSTAAEMEKTRPGEIAVQCHERCGCKKTLYCPDRDRGEHCGKCPLNPTGTERNCDEC